MCTQTSETFSIYTDGSCEFNPGGRGGWGYVILDADGATVREDCGSFSTCSTGGMEARAIAQALQHLGPGDRAVVYSDSRVALSAAKKGKALKPRRKSKVPYQWDYVQATRAIHGELARIGRSNVKFEHVPGHAGNAGNERADQLATRWRSLPRYARRERPSALGTIGAAPGLSP